MKTFNLPLFLATLLAGASMVVMQGQRDEEPETKERGADPYSRGQGGYHAAPSVGYGRPGGYGFPGFAFAQPFAYPAGVKPLDALDKLYNRLDTVRCELKSAAEILGNLEARQSLIKDILTRDAFNEEDGATEIDDLQNARLTLLEAMLDDLEQVLDGMDSDSDDLDDVNDNANHRVDKLHMEYDQFSRNEPQQIARLEELNTVENGLKDKLLTILDNELAVRASGSELSRTRLEVFTERENNKVCEVGQVTLDKDDRKAEYLFQNTFARAPQVIHSLCGYDFNVDVRPDSYYNSYYKEPNALGVLILADPSPTGLTLEMVDQSFGDTSILSADVCFQACSIGTGQFRVPEGHVPITPEATTPSTNGTNLFG